VSARALFPAPVDGLQSGGLGWPLAGQSAGRKGKRLDRDDDEEGRARARRVASQVGVCCRRNDVRDDTLIQWQAEVS
jgi:hypothetical protein